ncbi:Imm1 family immunity protein [Plantactinospora sp. B6F1]|uniref:Imm1 family immunity protein n=1 Tax=Plantactinospora sp. B6F1 TaxID=3158971 RepID=UPI00102B8F48
MDGTADQIEAVRRSGASSLDLSGHSLGTLPESLAELTGLTRLILVDNQLSALPEWLGNLTALTELGLGNNQLTVLPESLGNLTGLTWLGLSGNRLSTLPESLGNLTALTWLDLSGNRLSTLPESLGNLTALTWLDLTDNELSALPEWLGDLTALTRLDLTNNQLTRLPESLGSLAALTRLDLVGNRLTVVPQWLRDPTTRRQPVNAPVQAWIDDTCTTVTGATDLDDVLDRVPSSGVSLVSEDGVRSLHVTLDGGRSGLVWEDERDVLLSWGPVPPGAPPGMTAGDAEYVFSDPWFTVEGAEPGEITEGLARQAAHEFLGTGRRPSNVQWVDKP